MKVEKWVKVAIAIGLIIAVLALFTCYAYAQIAPLPIAGQISNCGFAQIKITNLRTSESIVTDTIGRYYLYDWANSVQKYQYGDNFNIEVVGTSKSQTVLFTGSPIEVSFDLAGECQVIPTPTVTSTVTSTIPPLTVTTTVTPTCPECPAQDYTVWSVGLIAAIAVIFAGLIKKYTPYKGKTKIETYLKKDGSAGYRFYSYESYIRKDGTAGYHWVKKKEW